MIEKVQLKGGISEPSSGIPLKWRDMRSEFGYKLLGDTSLDSKRKEDGTIQKALTLSILRFEFLLARSDFITFLVDMCLVLIGATCFYYANRSFSSLRYLVFIASAGWSCTNILQHHQLLLSDIDKEKEPEGKPSNPLSALGEVLHAIVEKSPPSAGMLINIAMGIMLIFFAATSYLFHGLEGEYEVFFVFTVFFMVLICFMVNYFMIRLRKRIEFNHE